MRNPCERHAVFTASSYLISKMVENHWSWKRRKHASREVRRIGKENQAMCCVR